MSEPLATHLTRYLRNPEEFARALQTPLLVFEPPVDEDSLTDVEAEEEYRLRTQSSVGAPSLGANEPLVFAVKKVADNAFKRGVTVGRTSNNDVVLDDGSVSRFHAWMIHDATTGRWALTDAGSKNGTFLNGAALKAKTPTPLTDRARLRFGQVELVFYAPAAFLDLLKRRLGRT